MKCYYCEECGEEYDLESTECELCPKCYEGYGYNKEKKKFDIVAFEVPNHKSLIYRRFLTEEQLLKAISDAIKKNANVMSIRLVKAKSQEAKK